MSETYTMFAGRLYDHEDARRRKPEAWHLQVTVCGPYLNAQGEEYMVERETWERTVPPGLGHFEDGGNRWIYVCPNGYAVDGPYKNGSQEPPPLPRPKDEHRRCGCIFEVGPNGYEATGRRGQGQHTCSACGQPFWVEHHGVADGYCTYCYYHG